MAFVKKEIESLLLNPFDLIGNKWFLLTSGTLENYNTMTCSWGALGEIWNVPSLTAYVRSSRYTFEFMEKNPLFTVSIFPEQYRKELAFCGSHSGRDCNKALETGLTPVQLDGSTAFAEAETVFVCEKMYAQMLNTESFIIKEPLKDYYAKDAMHKMYLGKITAVYENQT